MAPEPGTMTTYVEIEPMCGKVIKAPIKCVGVIPKCDIKEPIFELGNTYIGSYHKAPFTLTNPSAVQASAVTRAMLVRMCWFRLCVCDSKELTAKLGNACTTCPASTTRRR